MMMEPFHNQFLDIAEKETRGVIIPPGKKLPAGEYFFSQNLFYEMIVRRRPVLGAPQAEPERSVPKGWRRVYFKAKFKTTYFSYSLNTFHQTF